MNVRICPIKSERHSRKMLLKKWLLKIYLHRVITDKRIAFRGIVKTIEEFIDTYKNDHPWSHIAFLHGFTAAPSSQQIETCYQAKWVSELNVYDLAENCLCLWRTELKSITGIMLRQQFTPFALMRTFLLLLCMKI